MFGDGAVERRASEQAARLEAWLDSVQHPVVIEIGAGTAIPSVRYFSEQAARRYGAGLVRINPRDGEVPGHSTSACRSAPSQAWRNSR